MVSVTRRKYSVLLAYSTGSSSIAIKPPISTRIRISPFSTKNFFRRSTKESNVSISFWTMPRITRSRRYMIGTRNIAPVLKCFFFLPTVPSSTRLNEFGNTHEGTQLTIAISILRSISAVRSLRHSETSKRTLRKSLDSCAHIFDLNSRHILARLCCRHPIPRKPLPLLGFEIFKGPC